MISNFELNKQNALSKIDKSSKGNIDKVIGSLISTINAHSHLYTTSSCAGRIVLMTMSDKKNECIWLFKSHSRTQAQDILDSIANSRGDVWFRMEPVILHVCARRLQDAEHFLQLARAVGLKRGGIISTKKLAMEIQSTEHIATLLVKDGKRLVSDEYISTMVDLANTLLKNTHKKIATLKTFIGAQSP